MISWTANELQLARWFVGIWFVSRLKLGLARWFAGMSFVLTASRMGLIGPMYQCARPLVCRELMASWTTLAEPSFAILVCCATARVEISPALDL